MITCRLTSIIRGVCQPFLDQNHRQLVQFTEMIARMRNLVRLESEPTNRLENLIEVDLLFGFWVRIVETKVAISSVIFSESEIDRDRFRMTDLRSIITSVCWESAEKRSTDMQESIRLRRESRKHFSLRERQMLFHPLRNRLSISSRLM